MNPTFSHLDPGTPAEAWQPLLRDAPFLDLPPPNSRVVVVVAHPDDETLGAGGMIAQAAARGVGIVVVFATDGEGSHPRSPTHSPQRLAAIRRDESGRAVRALAPDAVIHHLGLPDGQLADHMDELRRIVAGIVAETDWLLSPWLEDGHPDHEACAIACRAVATLYHSVVHREFAIWAWHWADPRTAPFAASQLRRVALEPAARAARDRALACYPSQLTALSDAPGDERMLSESFCRHFTRQYDVLIDVGPGTVADEYFVSLYENDPDPWGLAERWYEQRKRGLLAAALPRPRFASIFEPGCSIGLLTAELATRGERVLAVDANACAVEQARRRLVGYSNVCIRQARIPHEWPVERFDLIVLSEVGYYFADLGPLAARIADTLTDDGVLALCHWRRAVPEHARSGESVHAWLPERLGLTRQSHYADADFLLDICSARPESVAQRAGIVA